MVRLGFICQRKSFMFLITALWVWTEEHQVLFVPQVCCVMLFAANEKKKKKLMELAVTQWESVFGGWRRLVPTWLRYTVLLCQSVFSLQKHTGRTELQYQLTNTHTLSHTGRFPHPELNPPRPLWPFRKVFDPWAPVLDKSVHVCVSYGETKRPRETKSKFPDFQLILSD